MGRGSLNGRHVQIADVDESIGNVAIACGKADDQPTAQRERLVGMLDLIYVPVREAQLKRLKWPALKILSDRFKRHDDEVYP